MEILAALFAAVVSGTFSWFITRWQYKQQLAAKERELDTQGELVKLAAATEARIRMQVEEYKHLSEFSNTVFRHFVDIDHDAGHIINGTVGRNISVAPPAEFVRQQLLAVRALIRGEAQGAGEEISDELLAATEMWLTFLKAPEPALRMEAHKASMLASRKLRSIVENRRMTLGAD